IILPPSHNRPRTDGTMPTRSAILVSPRLDTAQWMDLSIDSPDVTGIQIWGDFGTIRLINIYNDCKHSAAIHTVRAWLDETDTPPAATPPGPEDPAPLHRPPKHPVHDILLGDFNCHHPLWDDDRNTQLFTTDALAQAQPLLDL